MQQNMYHVKSQQTQQQINDLIKSITYKEPFFVAKQLNEVKAQYISLIVEAGLHVFNDGTESKLAHLIGTIPISFQGCHYNTPVDIWIPIEFPNKAPMCYVIPQQQMAIRSNHQYVDNQGLIYHPYLAQWNRTSKLTELIRTLCHVFSIMPPLFAKPQLSKQESLELNEEELRFINDDIQQIQLEQQKNATSKSNSNINPTTSARVKLEKLVKQKLQLIYDDENKN